MRVPPEILPRIEQRSRRSLALSLIAPVYNEEENVRALHARVVEIFGARDDWELVLVDDGSRDQSSALIRALAAEDARVCGVFFAHNCGQTAATAAGIEVARGRLIATLDADLQNDPSDLPAMLAALAGHDAVVGYRVRRQDTLVRRLSSRFANAVRNWLSQDQIRDTGCSLKVFRAEAIRDVPLFEGMHRFLPTLLRYHGYSVIEHPVSHRPRTAGTSKYGVMNRAWRSFKDLLAVRWMRQRLIRLPIREIVDALDAPWVLAAGWLGQGFFFSRFFVQWLASERAGRSVVPRSFWWMSIVAAALLSLYTIPRGEPVLLPGFLVTGSLAVRNLWLVRRGPGAARLGTMPFFAIGLGIAVLLFASGAFEPRQGLHEAPVWLALGILGQTLWTSRFIVQWWYAERRGLTHFPPAFWWISLCGNLLLLVYAIHLRDPVYIAGFVPGPVLHVRNLMLSRDGDGKRSAAIE